MNIIILLKLCLINSLLSPKAIGVLILQKYDAATRSGGNYRIHDNDIRCHYIVGQLGRTSIHEQGGDHDDQGATHQEGYVLVREQAVLVSLVDVENYHYLVITQARETWVQLAEFLQA
jgi:hypothetical protein